MRWTQRTSTTTKRQTWQRLKQQQKYQYTQQVALTEISVYTTSGTKDLQEMSLHHTQHVAGSFGDEPFQAINCARGNVNQTPTNKVTDAPKLKEHKEMLETYTDTTTTRQGRIKTIRKT